MKRSLLPRAWAEMQPADMAEALDAIQDVLWLDVDGEREFVNPDKEWTSETIEIVARILTDRKLGPTSDKTITPVFQSLGDYIVEHRARNDLTLCGQRPWSATTDPTVDPTGNNTEDVWFSDHEVEASHVIVCRLCRDAS